MAKYQQRPVDVFVWDGDRINALRAFVTPLVAESCGRVAAVPKIEGAAFLTPGDCIMKFASGGFTICDGALFAAEYDPV